jgi:hypothetical protein
MEATARIAKNNLNSFAIVDIDTTEINNATLEFCEETNSR